MNYKQKKEYVFNEYLKGRSLKDISEDLDEYGNKIISYSSITKLSSKENWREKRKIYIEEMKEEIKNELLAEELNFSKKFLKRANNIIDISLDAISRDGFRDEKALVQFLKFVEDYKDKIKEVETTINIKQEVVSDKEQIELLKKLSDVIENDVNDRADSFLEEIKEVN